MRLFISEYVCGGDWPEAEIDPSLAREGRAMLEVLLAGAARIPDVELVTTWDARLAAPACERVQVCPVHSPNHEGQLFRQLASDCDATLAIAPEFDGLLGSRAAWVEQHGRRWLGCHSAAIETCADKLRLTQVLEQAGVPTIPTQIWNAQDSLATLTFPFPVVVKPRDGAGSQDTFLIADAAAWRDWHGIWSSTLSARSMICQPFVPGKALSVGLILGSPVPFILPVCEQLLSTDGRFHYLGGRTALDWPQAAAVQEAAWQACRQVSRLRSYVGVDLVLPDDGRPPLVVEINPRLTTSFLGYSRLCAHNLAERVLFPESSLSRPSWQTKAEEWRMMADGGAATNS